MGFIVKIIDQGKNFEVEQREFLDHLSNAQIGDMAFDTERIIKANVTGSLKRPGSTGNLALNIFAEKIGNRSWGIGNILLLNQNAKYWKWLNYGIAGSGRRVPPPSSGSFSPLALAPDATLFREGRFSNDGSFFMTPKRPIEPHNYIEKTLAEVPAIIKRAFSIKR